MPLAGLGACLGLVGCDRAPSQAILGSYFPTWMVCALVALVGVAVIHRVLVLVGVDKTLPAPALVYLAMGVALTIAVWLLWLD